MKPTARAHIVFIGIALLGWGLLITHSAGDGKKVLPRKYGPFSTTRPHPLPYVCPPEYLGWVIYYCDESGTPVFILCRLLALESAGTWNPRVIHVNDNGSVDRGLAQINDGAREDLRIYNDGAEIDPYDPETSIRVCARGLAANYITLGSWSAASQAWNRGVYGYLVGNRSAAHARVVEGK
jgi:hypothetical protein